MITMEPLPGIRIRRLRLAGIDRTYDVDFTTEQRVRNLSVIAGAFSSGKTAVLEFIAYGFGARRHPRHQEVLRKVRSCLLEVELSGESHVIERSVGEPSKVAFVRRGTLDSKSMSRPESRPIDPPGSPESLSTLLLSHCKLEGVQLREAPTSRESRTDPLSFRDLMWLAFLPNERVADKNFLFENDYMRKHKLRQVVDVVFGVHDDRAVELGQRIRELGGRLSHAKAELVSARAFVQEQAPSSSGDAISPIVYEQELTNITSRLQNLDQTAQAGTAFAARLRREHQQAAQSSRGAAAILRDRETQLARLMPLRAQYADDLLKLGMLGEAQQLFDPLNVTACPACLNRLPAPPTTVGGRCSLCSHDLTGSDGVLTLGAADTARQADGNRVDVAAEIRSTRARLKEITTYIEDLDASLAMLKLQAEDTAILEEEASAALDEATSPAVSPFLAARDDLHRRREQILRLLDQAESTAKLHEGLAKRAATVERHETQIAHLKEELTQLGDATHDRDRIIAKISSRYGELLREWRYPKIGTPFIKPDLTPFVRGEPYQEASSGARTLLTLAWQLAVFEIAVETGAAHPGFLMIDSPQKNLGHGGTLDTVFADAIAIDDFYNHLSVWLAERGTAAQLIVVDNSPPLIAEGDVVARYSRNEDRPPYGLIEDETSAEEEGVRQ
ncbi:DNA recombination protein RecN [Streptomyces sp. H10-C2]|uniref:DNA recombination protein RecN n=1 Tax=unclassified Streptomyces TaxID=2593676 RepID=UPI0024BB1F43|nr:MULTISPECIES: DNA recombination protein RecN [unclassified Streptomyces]MDJ0347367.1 DNA recombination protein RecN [Streptomyces sp. PH10-H1]MDJ0375599.1 DNA recombination protein RecN [Streptomyces sp. H10-C2]